MKIRAGATTDTGRVRECNEDAYARVDRRGLFVVCDGMGGEAAGEVASRLAVDTVSRELTDRRPPTPESGEFLARTAQLAEAVRSSNRVIYEQAQADARQTGMGTTLVGVWIADHIASLAHVGDSRAYLWHDHHLEALTRDHSLVEAQVDAGLLTREESRRSPEQNVLLRVLGREPEVEVDLAEVPVQPGDYLLLCSDGLTRMVDDAGIADAIATLRGPQRICDHLVAVANTRGGPDNVTVVVVEIVDSWWRRWRSRGTERARGDHHAQADPEV